MSEHPSEAAPEGQKRRQSGSPRPIIALPAAYGWGGLDRRVVLRAVDDEWHEIRVALLPIVVPRPGTDTNEDAPA